MIDPHACDYPLYDTLQGGLVRQVNGVHIFVQAPDERHGLKAGDRVPEEWCEHLSPANMAASDLVPPLPPLTTEEAEFNRDLEYLFGMLFEQAERGEISYGDVASFLPSSD